MSLALFPASLVAQEFTETFPTDMRSSPPGWTARSGKWEVLGGRLITDGDTTWSFLTLDGYKPRNCVLDMEVGYYPSGIQFGGGVVRYTSDTDNLMCKLQENSSSSRDFDHAYIYERPRTAAAQWVFAPLAQAVPSSAIVRFVCKDSLAEMQIDFERDGVFDAKLVYPITSVLSAGLVGINIYGFAEVDNFEYFNAILQPAKSARPKIGTAFQMELTTDRAQALPWRIALSGSNTGFAMGARRIPLGLDPIFDLSLAAGGSLGLAGTTDAQGRAQPALVIPNLNSLVGLTVFASAITLDGTQPYGIDRISNEIAITFE